MDRDGLLSLARELKSNRKLDSFDEAATKQVVILRILSLLGWDIYNVDEVTPEYQVAGTKVDYSLRHSGKNKAFIEVKRAGESLDRHQEQLLNYSFKEGIQLAILTNGITWWFYLPLQEANWEQRKFYTIDIYDQASDDIVDRLIEYLSKANVITGKAVESARSTYRTRQKEYEISKALPKAWDKLISEPDDILIDLIAKHTEGICGYRPDSKTVENFLSSFLPGNVEDLIPQITKAGTGIKKVADTTRKKTLEYVLRNASQSLTALFFKLRDCILSLGDNVREVPNDWYCDYRKSSTFVTVNVQTKNNQLLLYIKMGERKIVDPNGWTSSIPDTYSFGKLNTQFAIKEEKQIDYAMQLIKQAYEYVP